MECKSFLRCCLLIWVGNTLFIYLLFPWSYTATACIVEVTIMGTASAPTDCTDDCPREVGDNLHSSSRPCTCRDSGLKQGQATCQNLRAKVRAWYHSEECMNALLYESPRDAESKQMETISSKPPTAVSCRWLKGNSSSSNSSTRQQVKWITKICESEPSSFLKQEVKGLEPAWSHTLWSVSFTSHPSYDECSGNYSVVKTKHPGHA